MIDLEKEREAFIKVYTEIYGEHDQLWQGWKKCAELAQDEITELKQKLARYENPNYVLVPRMPTKNMLDAGFVDGDYGCSTLQIYKAMIEAVEKEDE